MAKTLVLVRHSKAEERHIETGDINRPLTEKGRTDTFRMADFLFRSGFKPDLILSSNATRARETADIFTLIFKVPEKNQSFSKALYYSTAKTILNHLYVLPETIHSVLIVAHNPGISDLVRGLSSGQAAFMENTQACYLNYEIEHWYQLGENKPSLIKSHKVSDITETI
jgi:phosphohistidine phosphatase